MNVIGENLPTVPQNAPDIDYADVSEEQAMKLIVQYDILQNAEKAALNFDQVFLGTQNTLQ
jgi:hypothetical protein